MCVFFFLSCHERVCKHQLSIHSYFNFLLSSFILIKRVFYEYIWLCMHTECVFEWVCVLNAGVHAAAVFRYAYLIVRADIFSVMKAHTQEKKITNNNQMCKDYWMRDVVYTSRSTVNSVALMVFAFLLSLSLSRMPILFLQPFIVAHYNGKFIENTKGDWNIHM